MEELLFFDHKCRNKIHFVKFMSFIYSFILFQIWLQFISFFNGMGPGLGCLRRVSGLELVLLKVVIIISNLIQQPCDCCESPMKLS